ncbi:MAG: CHAT domain-containing protein, partial [Acidobacteria bacterium]|nr:CHAT domain-containing protein [Acidobacteriota bacterium]
GIKNAEVLALGHLGAMYAETADYEKAETLLNEALPKARELSDPEPQATILMRLAYVAKEREQWQAALQFCQQAEALIKGKPRKLRDIELLYYFARVYVGLKQYDQARARFEQAGRLARELHAPQFGAILLGDYAELQRKTGQFAAAHRLATEAVTLLQRGGGSPHRVAQILATNAEALRALHRNDEAWRSYQQALAALERARAFSIPTEIARAGLVATRHQVYAGAIALLLHLNRPAEAFDVAESYHARAFLDVLAESSLDQLGHELNAAQQAREDELLARVSNVQRQLWQSELAAEAEPRLQRELADAENALELFHLELRRQNPRFATVQAPQPLSHQRITSELLDAQTALVEYVVSDEQSFAWVVTQGQVHSVTLPGGKELAEAVTAYRTAASSKVSSSQAAAAIAKLKTQSLPLYQKLIAPLEPHLKQTRKLIIVADGALTYLPFEALAGGAQRNAPFLLERFTVSYAPSASALVALRSLKQSDATKGLIAFGDPVYATTSELRQLPYTRHEVNAIAALFSPTESRIWLGAEANEPNSKAERLNQFRYVHFATHALIDEAHPARSGIVLAQSEKEDGMLQMSEVMRLKLNADLVTLSACRTGLGQLLRGEGIIGLTRAFLYAGAESVTVSLWNVNDIATASLMKSFYKNLQQGQAKDDALRQAKLELLKGAQPAWHHPYYWAAFVLVGDPQ